jgi:transposase
MTISQPRTYRADQVMQEVKDLIAFYAASGSNWLDAAEFTLAKHSGRFELLLRTRIGVGYGRPRS